MQMKPASCFRLAPCFCLSRLRAGRRRRQRLGACENLRHIYNILILGAQKFAMRQCYARLENCAISNLARAALKLLHNFHFFVRTFKICAPDAMFLNFARLCARSEKVAQPRSRLRDTNFPVWGSGKDVFEFTPMARLRNF